MKTVRWRTTTPEMCGSFARTTGEKVPHNEGDAMPSMAAQKTGGRNAKRI